MAKKKTLPDDVIGKFMNSQLSKVESAEETLGIVEEQKPTATPEPQPEGTEAQAPEPTTPTEEEELISQINNPEYRAMLKARLEEKRKQGRGRPKKVHDNNGKRKDTIIRTSMLMEQSQWNKLHEITLRDTITLKDLMDLIIRDFISRYEEAHGEIYPQQREKKGLDDLLTKK